MSRQPPAELIDTLYDAEEGDRVKIDIETTPIWKRGYWWVFGRGEQDALADEE